MTNRFLLTAMGLSALCFIACLAPFVWPEARSAPPRVIGRRLCEWQLCPVKSRASLERAYEDCRREDALPFHQTTCGDVYAGSCGEKICLFDCFEPSSGRSWRALDEACEMRIDETRTFLRTAL